MADPVSRGYSYRPTRPPRFVCGGVSGSNPAVTHTNNAQLRAELARSTATRSRQGLRLHETAGQQLDAFMDALEQVERAGSALHTLPRERLTHIQRILRAGVDGAGIASLPNAEEWPPSMRRLSHQRERRADRAAVGSGRSEATSAVVEEVSDRGATSGPAASGLSTEELARLSTFVLPRRAPHAAEAEAETCPICLCDLCEGETVTALACAHTFHRDCSVRWLALSTACPLCKMHAVLGVSSDSVQGPEPFIRRTAAPTSTTLQEGDDDNTDRLLSSAAAAIGASRAASLEARVSGAAAAPRALASTTAAVAAAAAAAAAATATAAATSTSSASAGATPHEISTGCLVTERAAELVAPSGPAAVTPPPMMALPLGPPSFYASVSSHSDRRVVSLAARRDAMERLQPQRPAAQPALAQQQRAILGCSAAVLGCNTCAGSSSNGSSSSSGRGAGSRAMPTAGARQHQLSQRAPRWT